MGLLDDPNKSMFDFDITQLKSELLDHINELGNCLSTKIDIDDFYYDITDDGVLKDITIIYILIYMQ